MIDQLEESPSGAGLVELFHEKRAIGVGQVNYGNFIVVRGDDAVVGGGCLFLFWFLLIARCAVAAGRGCAICAVLRWHHVVLRKSKASK